MRVHRESRPADADRDEAWQLLTDPDELAAWLGTPVSLDLRPGGAAAYVEPDGTVRHAVIESVREGERLSASCGGQQTTTSRVASCST